jgi:hypothetical protein
MYNEHVHNVPFIYRNKEVCILCKHLFVLCTDTKNYKAYKNCTDCGNNLSQQAFLRGSGTHSLLLGEAVNTPFHIAIL